MMNKPCNNWAQTGSCKFGDNCRFSHGQGGGNQGNNQNGPMNSRSFNHTGPRNSSGFQSNNPGFQGSNQGFRGNQGFQDSRGPRAGGPRGMRQPRMNNETLCNYFLQGKCQRGDSCQNLHQFSLDWDILHQGSFDLTQKFGVKSINLISADIVDISDNGMIVLICTTGQLTFMQFPNFNKADIAVPDGTLTAMHYDRNNRLIFLAYLSTKTNKGGLRIYKDASGNGDFKEVVTATDLHQKNISAIDVMYLGDNMLIFTAGHDDHLKAWVLTNELKLDLVASGLATDPIYSMACLGGEIIIAGCGSGKVAVFKVAGAKEFAREKVFEIHADPASLVTKILVADDAIYATTYCNSNNNFSGQVGFMTASGTISHLVSTPLANGAITLAYMPGAEVIFIGYGSGELEFRDKEGFTEKGKAQMHRAAIREIKQFNNMFLVADESGVFSIWQLLDEKTAEENKSQYMAQRQQNTGGGFGGGGFGGNTGGGGFGGNTGGGGFGGGGFGGNTGNTGFGLGGGMSIGGGMNMGGMGGM